MSLSEQSTHQGQGDRKTAGMYESAFNLPRRPFAATPDPACVFRCETNEHVFQSLKTCLQRGQGIGLLTGAAGVGKTLLISALLTELRTEFQTVCIANPDLKTRRALLQAVLFELGEPYSRKDEQELRLDLRQHLQRCFESGESICLAVDEAHLFPDDLIEELRLLADWACDGQPLVRLLLAGQLSLEERLTEPAFDAINQRLGAHVMLDPLTREESVAYINFRLHWADANPEQFLTDDARECIARASGGLPRCIHQLADHSLIKAFHAQAFPVSEETVREALQDLKQLPLQWNDLHDLSMFESAATDEAELEPNVSLAPEESKTPEPARSPQRRSQSHVAAMKELAVSKFQEEIVIDHYASLQEPEFNGIIWTLAKQTAPEPVAEACELTLEFDSEMVGSNSKASEQAANSSAVFEFGSDDGVTFDAACELESPLSDEIEEPEVVPDGVVSREAVQELAANAATTDGYAEDIRRAEPKLYLDAIMPMLDEVLEETGGPVEMPSRPRSLNEIESDLIDAISIEDSQPEDEIGADVLDLVFEARRARKPHQADDSHTIARQLEQMSLEEEEDETFSLSGFDVVQPELPLVSEFQPTQFPKPRSNFELPAQEMRQVVADKSRRPFGRLFTDLRRKNQKIG